MIAISKPFLYMEKASPRTALRYLAGLWLVSFVIALPYTQWFNAREGICISESLMAVMYILFNVWVVQTFLCVTPVIVMNAVIVWMLWKKAARKTKSVSAASAKKDQKSKDAKTKTPGSPEFC